MYKVLLVPDWRAKVVFSPDGPQPTILSNDESARVVIAGLEAGQQLPPHTSGLGIYHFLEGTGWMTVDGERLEVAAGATVIVPQGSERGIEAETRLAFLATRVC
jgi:quercetin dioxygenase-like cupin family protein